MVTTHLVTGATGLLGAALVLRLAEQTDDRLLCLVRPAKGSATGRLRTALRNAAEAYGVPHRALDAALARTRTLPFDLSDRQPAALAPQHVPGEVEIWHSAALMRFHPRDRRESFAANRAGTERLLRLSRHLPVRAFNHVSTAYVAGRHEGLIPEAPPPSARPRNPYEASKLSAERRLLRESGVPIRILRPSVIVGHSRTLRYPGSPSGLFVVQRLLAAHLRRAAPGRSPRITALPGEPLDLIPVDHVAEQAVLLSAHQAPAGHYHLTNPASVTTGAALRALVANTGTPAPAFVPGPGHSHPDDRLLHRLLTVYLPYFTNPQRFDRARTDAALGGPGPAWTPGQDALRHMFRPFTEAVPPAAR